jgi:SPP1 family predicted phage head-tail adaptor
MIEDKFVKNILIESSNKTPDGFGNSKTTWATYLNVEGRIFDVSTRDAQIAVQGVQYSTHYLLCNYKNLNGTVRTISNKNRVHFGEDIYTIQRVRQLLDSTDEVKYLKLDLFKVS